MQNNIVDRTAGGDWFDIAKFLLALLVFAHHANALNLYWFPLIRIAVPLFFIISSYFFFSKFDNESDPQKRKEIYKRFIKRQLLLYLFWTIIQLGPILEYRTWFSHPFPSCIAYLLQSVFFGSTFVASWYIMATVIGTSILILISKHGINALTVIISVVTFLFCCLSSNYRNVFPWFQNFYKSFSAIFINPYTNFITSLMWISMGRYFSTKNVSAGMSGILVAIAFSTVTLFAEWKIVGIMGWRESFADYLSLAVLCPSIFMLIANLPKVTIPYAMFFRKFSVVIFCTHGSILYVLIHLFDELGMAHNVRYATLLTLPCCLLIYYFIRLLSNRIPFLKYAY